MTNPHIAVQTAKMLLQVGAISIRSDSQEPFCLTSGRLSPVYVDCRKLISYPRIRRRLTDFAQTIIEEEIGYEAIEVVAGGETAGIPYAAWIADRLMQPMLYVRKKPKGFGRNAQIEGDFKDGMQALLVEDLATDGGSKIKFCRSMREAGLQVSHAFVIFYYDSIADSMDKFTQEGISLHWLTSWKEVLKECYNHNSYTQADIQSVEAYLADPQKWEHMKKAKNE